MISLNVVGSPMKCIVKFFTAFVVNKAVIVAFVFYNQQCVPEDFVNCKHVTFSNVGFRGTNQSSKAGGTHIGNLKTRNDTKWKSGICNTITSNYRCTYLYLHRCCVKGNSVALGSYEYSI